MFLILLVISALVIKPFIIIIFLSALLAYVFYPIYNWISQKIRNKTISALLICLLVLIILIVPAVFLLKSLVYESYVLFISVKQKLAVGLLNDCSNTFCESIKSFGDNLEVRYHIQESTRSLTNWIIKKSSDFLVSIPLIILNLFVLLFTMYYFLKDGSLFVKKMSEYLSMKKNEYSLVITRLKEIIHGIVFGYLLVALIQGVLGALGFFIFGVSSPIFWGLVMAFLALIPYLGTGLVWVPAALILFFDGYFNGSNWLMFKGIALAIYSFIFVASIDNLLRPKLVGDKAKVHPAIVMIGIFGGIFVFGPLGVIIGPLVLSLTSVVFKYYLANR